METPLSTRVQEHLAAAQPMLGLHGGKVELAGITDDNVVQLRFLGACIGCAAAEYTLEYGLKEMLMIAEDDINDVVAVNDEPITHAAPTIPYAFDR